VKHPNQDNAERGERAVALGPELARPLRRAMDALYWTCAVIAGSALVIISLVVPWGVYTRYVLDSAASWPEPMAILLSIVLTFFGAAACYRSGTHMRVTVLRDRLQRKARAALLIGAAAEKIASQLEGAVPLIRSATLAWTSRCPLRRAGPRPSTRSAITSRTTRTTRA